MRKLKIKLTKLWRKFYYIEDNKANDTQNTASSIFRKALRNRSAELSIIPTANKRVIKIEREGLYILLQHTLLEITNHKYSYHLEINYNMYLNLSRMFDQKLEYICKIEEEAINNQLNERLKKVLKLINE